VTNHALIVETPHGATIQKTKDGRFLVCDSEKQCHITKSLYSAEEQLESMEREYSFPYSTAFRQSKQKN